MTDRDKFLAVAVMAVSIVIVCKVSPSTAVMMAAMLFAVIYLAWRQLDRQ